MLRAIILYVTGGIYSLKSTLNDRFLRNFSMQIYLLSESAPEICWKEVAEEIFSDFRFNVWPGIWTRLKSQQTT